MIGFKFSVFLISFLLLISTVFLIWSLETLSYKKIYGKTLDEKDPNFDVYELGIKNSTFEYLGSNILHSRDTSTAIRYVSKFDHTLFKRAFYHIHSKELDDRRVLSGTELYQIISEIEDNTKKNRTKQRVERMKKYADM